MNRSIFWISYFIMGIGLSLFGQNKEGFYAEISSDSILLGNSIKYSISLSNVEGEVEFPDFKNLHIISGPNVMSSMHSINGKSSINKTYTFYLKPNDIGLYHIDPSYLKTENGVLESQYIEFNVHPNPDEIYQSNEENNESFFFDFSFPDDLFKEHKEPQKESPKATKRKLKRL